MYFCIDKSRYWGLWNCISVQFLTERARHLDGLSKLTAVPPACRCTPKWGRCTGRGQVLRRDSRTMFPMVVGDHPVLAAVVFALVSSRDELVVGHNDSFAFPRPGCRTFTRAAVMGVFCGWRIDRKDSNPVSRRSRICCRRCSARLR